MTIFLGTLFIIVCVLLIIVVLLQKGRGGGLGAAFGGAGSSAFGTRTGDVFTWVTIVLTGLFLLLAVGTTMIMRPEVPILPEPRFNPVAQEIQEPVEVEIVMDDIKATNLKIYYTTNNSDPSTNAAGSTLYTKGTKIRVNPKTTLKARAFADDWKPSPVAQAFYGPKAATKPATAPAATIIERPTTGTTQTAPATAGAR